MKRVVILGCENSHANSFLTFIKENAAFSDVNVLGVYTDEPEEAKKLNEKFGVPVMAHYADAVGKVDGVIITARHGDNHYKYAKPYIESGVPMFIDKPITVDETEAVSFMRECREAGVRVTGGSCCKYAAEISDMKAKLTPEDIRGGLVRAPINMENPYGGFFFYSQHLVEMMGELFGLYPRSVKAYRAANTVNVVFRYDGYDVIGLYTEFSNHYFVSVALGGETLASNATIGTNCFTRELDEFCDLLRGGEQTVTYDDFIAPVFTLNAIHRSLESGEEEAVHTYEV